MTPDNEPEHGRWGITVEMTGGPTRVEARWLHQGEVGGPWQEVVGTHSRRISLVLGERGGPAFLHQGSTFRVGVECPAHTASLDVTVSVNTAELAPGTDDEPTGRQWSHIEAVSAEVPPHERSGCVV